MSSYYTVGTAEVSAFGIARLSPMCDTGVPGYVTHETVRGVYRRCFTLVHLQVYQMSVHLLHTSWI
jgi:hypothetical protein